MFPRCNLVLLFAACCVFSLADSTSAQTPSNDWLGFRGSDGNGTSATATPPTTWSSTKNIAWKKKIPGKGSSSPIVVGNRVIITAATPSDPDWKPPKRMDRRELAKKFDENGDGNLSTAERNKAIAFMRSQQKSLLAKHSFNVLCYDRNSGELLWNKTATTVTPHEGHHSDHGYASASPVSDGEVVLVNFGSRGLFCFDLEGELKWKREDLGMMKTRGAFGEGSSVSIAGNSVVLPWDHEGQSRIEVIDRLTGETIWKKNREEPSNWVTPRVVEIEGRQQIVQAGERFSRGYDLGTGEEIWKASGLTMRPVATPAVMDNLAFVSSGRRGYVLQAIRLDQKGDISSNGIEWSISRQTPDIPSLLLSENRLFFVGGNNGILSCVDAKTGKPFFGPERLPLKSIYSSPVAADGKVFVTSRAGKTMVIKDAQKLERVSINDIGEPVDASLALSESDIFIRGRSHLYCVREK